jgi:hypothetical protein
MEKRFLIGLVGGKRSGKDSFADIVYGEALSGRVLPGRHVHVRRRAMAEPLRLMIKAGFPGVSFDDATKERPQDVLHGRDLRSCLQTLGTEWGRKHFGEDVWALEAIRWLKARQDEVFGECAGMFGVITDVRFINEASVIKEHGGFLVRIVPPGGMQDPTDAHVSEQEVNSIQVDRTIDVGWDPSGELRRTQARLLVEDLITKGHLR